MPQDPAAILSSLLRSASIDDHDEILKAANAALKANKNDVSTQHTRVVALLKLDRFDDALRAISEGGDKLGSLCTLEQAYALYKTGKLDEARTLLQSAGVEKRSFGHVAAQVAYRAERFDEARDIYNQILKTGAGNEENDVSINIRAAFAQSEWLGSTVPIEDAPQVQNSDGFELCYNAACACIGRGSFESASDLLQRALRLCDASEDLTPEDKEAEMRPIMAQQAYVYAKLGKLKEALDLYNTLGVQTDDERDFKIVVQNNSLALDTEPENPYLFQRKFSSFASSIPSAKLFNYQTNVLNRNDLVADLKVHKADGVKARTDKRLAKADHPSSSTGVNIFSVLNAAATTHGTTGKQAVRKLQSLATKRPHDVGLVLTIVQIQLQDGRVGAAYSVLESFLQRLDKLEAQDAKDVRFCPGLVALTVSLLRAQGREACAKAELVKAAEHWQTRPVGSAASLLKESGVELLKSSNAQDLQLAGASFQKLFAEHQGSHVAAAGLVAALAPSDADKVETHLQDLPPVEDLINDIDVAELIDAGVVVPGGAVQARKRAAAPTDAVEKTAKKRRKTKLPKNYVEGTKPDPERWLPLRDRSSYRPKGKKGKKKAAESTQGGVVKDEERLELVGGGGVKVEKAQPSSSKKKKKGKK